MAARHITFLHHQKHNLSLSNPLGCTSYYSIALPKRLLRCALLDRISMLTRGRAVGRAKVLLLYRRFWRHQTARSEQTKQPSTAAFEKKECIAIGRKPQEMFFGPLLRRLSVLASFTGFRGVEYHDGQAIKTKGTLLV